MNEQHPNPDDKYARVESRKVEAGGPAGNAPVK
jgi:hypothetical protein